MTNGPSMGPMMPGSPTGSPTTPGGRGGRSVGAAPRLTFFEWKEVVVTPMKVVTPEHGSTEEPMTAEKHLREVLGMDAAKRKGDERPVLLYFHWPHEHARHGKLTTTLCEQTLDDEVAARWGLLFRLVQIDMGESDAEMAKELGCKGKPGFAALDDSMEVKATFRGVKSSAKVRKALEAALKKFPAYWKSVKKRITEQGKNLEEAKRLEKRDEFVKALKLVDEVRFSKLRVGPHFDKAQSYGQMLAQKAERAHR